MDTSSQPAFSSGKRQGAPEEWDQARNVKRTRIRQACNRCKERKTKCNNQRPCAACAIAGVVCEDWRPGQSQGLHTSSGDNHYISQPSYHSSLEHVHASGSSAIWYQHARQQSSNDSSRTSWPHAIRTDRFLRQPLPYDTLRHSDRGLLEYAGPSAGYGMLSYLQVHRDNVEQQRPLDLESIPTLLHLPRSNYKVEDWPMQQSVRPVAPSAEKDLWSIIEEKLTSQFILALVRKFVETIYVSWPTFHVTDFLPTLANPEARQSPEFICLVVAACTVTVRDNRKRRKEGEVPGRTFYNVYVQVKTTSPERDWSSLASIQSLVYMAMYCYGGAWDKGIEEGHLLVAEAVSRTYTAGLHRNTDNYGKAFSEKQREERKRTLWAVYCIDKLSASFGRPVQLRLNDIDVEEITIDNAAYFERFPSSDSSLLGYCKVFVRLNMVFERILNKINISSCTKSAAILDIAIGKRSISTSGMHIENCPADHRGVDFQAEIELLGRYESQALPADGPGHGTDQMQYSQKERLQCFAFYCRLVMLSHTFNTANSDLSTEVPIFDSASGLLDAAQALVDGHGRLLNVGHFADFGSSTVHQLGQAGRALLPVIYLINHITSSPPSMSAAPDLQPYQQACFSCLQILRQLSDRFDAAVRHVEYLESTATKLGITLDGSTGASAVLPIDETLTSLVLNNLLDIDTTTGSTSLATHESGISAFGDPSTNTDTDWQTLFAIAGDLPGLGSFEPGGSSSIPASGDLRSNDTKGLMEVQALLSLSGSQPEPEQ